jgi:hypothetical protein
VTVFLQDLSYCFHVDCILGRANPLQRKIDMNHCANDEEGQLSRRHASRHARRFIDEGSIIASYFFDDEENEEELVLLQQLTT